MKKYEVENHEYSLLPKDKEWKLVWSDEFDGDTLDESKWSFRLNYWGMPFDGFTDKGVTSLQQELGGQAQDMAACQALLREKFHQLFPVDGR